MKQLIPGTQKREFIDAIREKKYILNGNSEQAYKLMYVLDDMYRKLFHD